MTRSDRQDPAGASGAGGAPRPMRYRAGVDIGGTFTDILLMREDGRIYSTKVSSTVRNYADAIIGGLRDLLELHGVSPSEIAEILHGTTVASNAILELKGARLGLIGTDGFRDVLEIRNLRMPRLYDLAWEKPPPLVERHLRVVVEERVDARGNVQIPLAVSDAEQAVERLLGEDVEAIAVCLLNAYANPVHERLLAEIVRRKAPHLPLSVSHEVLPEVKEYERTSTAVVNAYVLPLVGRYLATLRAELTANEVAAPLLLMQSNGGLTTDAEAAAHPVNIIESGPAGGVVGARAVATVAGDRDVISFDMGGTTAKASLIERGEFTRVQEYSVGGGIMIGSRLLTGSGYLIKVPAIDLAEVGAGGGSIVWIDPAGSMRIGPHSAGASPGPICYDLGGTEPTLTDANLVLGYLNPQYLCGGDVKLNAERTRDVLGERISTPLGLELAHAAYGAHMIAVSNMIRAIRAVSSERGRDPRDYALLAFGGNGPLFASSMAAELGMRRIIVPPAAGLFSAAGLLFAEVEHHYSRTVGALLRHVHLETLQRTWDTLERQARAQLERDGFAADRMSFERSATMHYKGQIFELTVPVPDGTLGANTVAELEDAFGAEHERTYGHRADRDEPVELVNAQLVGKGLSTAPRSASLAGAAAEHPPRRVSARDAYYGPRHGWLRTPIRSRAEFSAEVAGPCIVEEYDSTCLVPPGAHARLDEAGNLLIDMTG